MSKLSSPESTDFGDFMRDAETLVFITRDSDLQRECCARLASALPQLAEKKADAVGAGNEELANRVLGCECVVRAHIAELEMYLALKDGQPDAAWSKLVHAQTQIANALRSHPIMLEEWAMSARRLDAVQQIVFPPQVFLSAGLIVRRQICSICNDEYRNCDHIVGQPYWGEFCTRHLKDISADHVAIVKEPANKHCRITEFSVPGGRRNRMTWKISPEPFANPDSAPDGAMMTNAILLGPDNTDHADF